MCERVESRVAFGKKLADYFNQVDNDPVGARAIISTDKAKLIANIRMLGNKCLNWCVQFLEDVFLFLC